MHCGAEVTESSTNKQHHHHPSLVGSRTQLHAHLRVSVGHRHTRRADARLCLMGDPSQNAAPAAFQLGAAITARSLQVFKANVTLALHPCQTSAAHLACTRPPDRWALLGRPCAHFRPDGQRDHAAARAFVTTCAGFDTMARRHQETDDDITETDYTAVTATFSTVRPPAPLVKPANLQTSLAPPDDTEFGTKIY